jgi:PAS domain S-box-containing protein
LIPEELRSEAHLRIGRLLTAHTSPETREERIFEIVNQLNRASNLITAEEERERVAELNLIAGRRAKVSTAYASALNYLTAGHAMLSEEAWNDNYELIFQIERLRAECELLTADMEAAENRLSLLAQRARSDRDIGAIARLRLTLYTALDRSERGLEVCLEYLRRGGVQWSLHPTSEQVRQEYDRAWAQLGSRQIEDVVDLPWITDPDVFDKVEVLTEAVTPAVFLDKNLASLVICHMVNLSLQHGNSDGSGFAYVWFGIVAATHFGNPQDGFRFGRVGYELTERRGLKRYQARTYMSFGNLVMPYVKRAREGRELVRRAFDAAYRMGDLTFAAYSCDQLITNFLVVGDHLREVQTEAENGLAFAKSTRFGLVIDLISAQLQLIRTLRGLTDRFGSFDDGGFDELRFEQHLASNPGLADPEFGYWALKAEARFFAGDYAAAVDATSKAQQLLWAAPSLFEPAGFRFYGALSHGAFWDSASSEEKPKHLETLTTLYRELQKLADQCPENFDDRASLVGAEIARIEGRDFEAMRLYERAIRSAQASGFVHNEALANEIAARFYAARGFDRIADSYLREARYCYLRWGADGKVSQLDHSHPHLKEERPTPGPASMIMAPVELLDLATVIKISQAVSGEIVMDNLIDRLMRAAIEHAGAERGLLILPRGDELQIQAEANTSGGNVTVHLRGAAENSATFPQSIVRYITRTQENVILDDASSGNPFSADPYIVQHRARSILCLPLVNQAKLTAVLYLENNLTPHVFTPDRITVLKVLASQAAISLENTRLYRDVENREARFRRLVDANIMGIVIWNVEGAIVASNDSFLRMVQYDREDVASGRVRWRDMTPAEWRERTERALAEVVQNGTVQPFESELFRKDGSRVPILVGGALFEEGGDEGVAFALDLSEQKRAEEALRRSEAYLSEAQHLSRTGSFGCKPSSGEMFWSEETFRIFQYDRAMKPDVDAILRRVHPEDKALVQERIDLAINEGKDCDVEYRLLVPDHSIKHVHVVAHAVKDDQGGFEFAGAVMDVTEHRQASAQLLTAFEEIRALKDQLYKENLALRDEVDRASMFEEIIGASKPLKTVLSHIAKVASTESTVFITGETGTGKELIARAVHKRSQRSGRAFVSVNCAALAPTLISSELFGHEKGAFTGATQRRLGRFELADGGTIFLDEVGELFPDTQVALLRVLQEREFERVGGGQPIHVDVRVIAATNRDLKAAIASGTFRQDLFYRLNVFPIDVPPLRERNDDILMLVEYFVRRYASRMGKYIRSIDKKTLDLLQSYDWPGNIRELQNVIERSVILSSSDVLYVDELWLSENISRAAPGGEASALFKREGEPWNEKEIIESALAESRGRISGPAGAAAKLGIPPSTLDHRINALKINKNRFKLR